MSVHTQFPPTTLAQLIAQHDLLSANVSCMARGDGTVFYSANVQWADTAQDGDRRIASSHGDSPSEAMRGALKAMLEKRTVDLELVA